MTLLESAIDLRPAERKALERMLQSPFFMARHPPELAALGAYVLDCINTGTAPDKPTMHKMLPPSERIAVETWRKEVQEEAILTEREWLLGRV
jgi:hypothetical protein